MNRKTAWITKVGLELLGVGLLTYMAMRTLDFVSITMPPERQYWGYLFLLSTGAGAVIWAGVYLTFASGAKQRGISFVMGILDLLGELGLVYADTQYVASQAGRLVMTEKDLNVFILLSIGMIGINAVAYYFFKLFDPDVEADQQAQDLVDDVSAAAIKNLNMPEIKARMVEDHRPQIEAAIMQRVTSQIGANVAKLSNVINVKAPDEKKNSDPKPPAEIVEREAVISPVPLPMKPSGNGHHPPQA